jgi:phosphatidylserine/phosphatidylglycerophosphate/cardiolipin synthase-like enzyme
MEGVGGLRIMHDVGAKVHALKGMKLHAKMIVADDKRAVIGSINLAPGSFDARRELAIETDAHHVVSKLSEVAQRTGTIRRRSISATKACSPTSRSATLRVLARKCSCSRTSTRKRTSTDPLRGAIRISDAPLHVLLREIHR